MAHIAKLGAQTDEFISAFTGWPTEVSWPLQTLAVALFSLVPGTIDENTNAYVTLRTSLHGSMRREMQL